MEWFEWFAISSLIICVVSLIFHFIRILTLGKPNDLSTPTGTPKGAMPYAFTGSMSPTKKESAFLHLPTYLAGLVYHMGTFLSLFIFFLILFTIPIIDWLNMIIAGSLALSALSGFGILIKRMVNTKMRDLSNPDDYISNFLVSAFQLLTAYTLMFQSHMAFYFVFAGILFLYIPLSKLKHTIYFFAARYHLGFFFGWRGVWPPKKF